VGSVGGVGSSDFRSRKGWDDPTLPKDEKGGPDGNIGRVTEESKLGKNYD